MVLCENCLEAVDSPAEARFPIGKEFGSQRDPERHELTLCLLCRKALIEHDLDVFRERYSATREIRRDSTGRTGTSDG